MSHAHKPWPLPWETTRRRFTATQALEQILPFEDEGPEEDMSEEEDTEADDNDETYLSKNGKFTWFSVPCRARQRSPARGRHKAAAGPTAQNAGPRPGRHGVQEQARAAARSILDFNRNKGGMDNLDKVIGTYSCRRMTVRWPLAVFHNILDAYGARYAPTGCPASATRGVCSWSAWASRSSKGAPPCRAENLLRALNRDRGTL
ncbi:hypothetical protein DPEC_G00146400 [Dallia pectoralis]|uniref:Uncharacterized protein n=1 Tax=Dallia pectoralis TaxID=75939 RepID=A0ACC2GNU5_DALPE|nr:hypothetical protein DPEC_G00146400 [Dallia pectoralis]